MPRSARPDRQVFALGLAAIALVTLWRVAMLPLDRADLFVDDAQYWLWGQELAWGYYSKPPLIGWILRLSTDLGSDDRFWIRLPLPLIHAATAVLIATIARRLYGPRIAGIAGAGFVTLPAVALGSLLVSTDTPLLFFFALAMLAQLRLARSGDTGAAVLLGVAVGAGLLAKYAMIYFPLSAALAALVAPMARIGWRGAAIAAVVALAVVAPNLVWNATNGFATVHHTAYNADWHGSGFDFAGLSGFFAGQFAVAGLFFAAFLAGLGRVRRDPAARYLVAMALPVLAIVSVQASISGANANWAAVAHLGALVLACAVLAGRRRLLIAAFGVNLVVTFALPVATAFADRWQIGDELVLRRYVGQAAVSRHAAEIAKAEGLDTLVSGNRAMLADFFYTLRDSGLEIRAVPVEGFPPHHYAQKHPLTPGPGDVLLITRDDEAPECLDAAEVPREVARWTPADGFVTDEIRAFRVHRACWFPAKG